MKTFFVGVGTTLLVGCLGIWLASLVGANWIAWLVTGLILVGFGLLVCWFWRHKPEEDSIGSAMTLEVRRFLVLYLLLFCTLLMVAITVLFSFNFLVAADGKPLTTAAANSIPKPGEIGYLNTWWHQQWAITFDMQFILLAICAGALGSSIHALKSLGDFLGNRTDKISWFWFYITRPFLGSTLALIFYAVLRGGLMTGTPADAAAVNPFGIMALCGLCGMFADRASQKLGEIFDTLFKTEDARKDKLEAVHCDRLDPATILVGSATCDVTVHGTGLVGTSKVRVNGTDRAPKSVTDSAVIFTLTAPEMAAQCRLTVQLVTKSGALSKELILNISDIAITTAAQLQSGTVGQEYGPVQLQARGGTGAGSYSWTVSDLPQGIRLDKSTGELTGTPAAGTAGPHSVGITVTDREGAQATISADLKINSQ